MNHTTTELLRVGERLVEALGEQLTKQYGNGFSARSLWDMRRFFTVLQILPSVMAEFEKPQNFQDLRIWLGGIKYFV